MMPELIRVVADWKKAGAGGVIVGGAALAYHVRPQMTQDLDILFLAAGDVPAEVKGFRRTRSDAFQHISTQLDVELVTPELQQVPRELASRVAETATETDGVRVAAAAGLVAMKLGRLSLQDKADIIALVKSGRIEDLETFPLSDSQFAAYRGLAEEAQTDSHP
jgi:hypothetical protein